MARLAFRRGLATNLYRLGIPDKTIQAILRHSNLSTTMNLYVKSVGADAVAAMNALEGVIANNATLCNGSKKVLLYNDENKALSSGGVRKRSKRVVLKMWLALVLLCGIYNLQEG